MKRGIKMLGLSMLMALSVMSITASGAQAEGQFRVSGKVLGKGEVAETEGTGGESQLEVPGLGLTIKCATVLLSAESENGLFHTHSEHHELRHSCTVNNKNCTIYPTEADLEKGTNAGLLLSFSLRLWRFPFYLRSVVQERFYFGGPICTLPEEVEISGETAVKFGKMTEEATTHVMEDITAKEEEELELPGLFFGEEPAEYSGGNTTVKLVGKFAGQKFSLN